MPKRVKQSTKKPDLNVTAFSIVQQATKEPESSPAVPASISEYMAQIGSKGGKIGGKKRLKTMTAEERRKVAKKAATARWKKKRP